MKILFKWVGNLCLCILVVIAIISIVSFIKSKSTKNYIPGIGSYKFLAVLSGSMSPTFNTYDMIVDKQVNTGELKEGDVITSRIEDVLVTHRITKVFTKDGDTFFNTKGDANNVEDDRVIAAKDVVGKYILHIPYMGLVMSKIRGPLGIGVMWAIFIFIAINEILVELNNSKKKKEQVKLQNQLLVDGVKEEYSVDKPMLSQD